MGLLAAACFEPDRHQPVGSSSAATEEVTSSEAESSKTEAGSSATESSSDIGDAASSETASDTQWDELTSSDGAETTDTSSAGCGNGLVEADEACDDGNEQDGDGCNVDCIVSGTELWTQSYNGAANGSDAAGALAIGPTGAVIVSGDSEQLDGTWSAWLRAYAGDGTTQWTVMPEATSHTSGGRPSVAVAEDDSIYLCGTVTGDGLDIWVIGLDPTGAQVWRTDYVGSAVGAGDECRGIAIAPDGALVVAGLEGTLAQAGDPWLAELDRDDGSVAWTTTLPGAGHETFQALEFLEDGRILAGGIAAPIDAANREAIVTLWEPAGSAPAWAWYYDAAVVGDDRITAVLADEDAVQVFGYGSIPMGSRGLEGSLDLEGVEQAVALSTDVGLVRINGAAKDDAGNLVLAGAHDGSGSSDAWVQKRSSSGDVLWTHVEDGVIHEEDSAQTIAIDDVGAIVVGGYTTVDGQGTDVWVRKLAP